MPTLVKTASAINANSYADEDDGDEYMETRLHTDNWDDATSDEREFALMWATRLLDTLCAWDGKKATDTQALRWPRSFIWDPDGDAVLNTVVPQFLIDATCEYALHLIGSDRTQTFDPELSAFNKLVIGPLEMEMSNPSKGQITKVSMIPESVWILVRRYCSRIGLGQKTTVRI